MAAAPTGTYTQNRKNNMMAYGGIAGADGRKKYGIGSWIQEKIMDPIKGLGGKTELEIINESQQRVDREQGIVRQGAKNPGDYPTGFNPKTDRLDDWTTIGDPQGTGAYTPFYEQMFDPIRNAYNNQANPLGFDVGEAIGKVFGTGDDQYGKYTIPMTIGAAAGKAQQAYLDKQPPFPMDQTGITFQTAQEAMDDPNLRFKPKLEDTQLAAEGGRIGYRNGIGPNQGSPGIMSQAITDTEVEDAFGMTVDQERAITDQQVEDAFGISVDDVAPVDKKKLKDLFRRLTEPREMAKYKNLLGKMGEEKIMTPPLGKIGEEKAATPLSDQSKHQNLMMLAEMFEAQGMEFADALKEAQDYFGSEGFGIAEGGIIGYKH